MSAEEIIEILKFPSAKDIELIKKAHDFAEEKHKDQKRDNGEPYFTHLFGTAKNLAELGVDAETISAGFLHDCIEDVGVKPEEIEKIFGKEILFLVEGVTKLGHLQYTGTKRHSENLRKLFVAMAQDLRVIVIKLADRLHNMRTLKYTSKEKQERVANETLEIYVPLAHRLGIRKFSRELEDLAFSYTNPEEFKNTEKILKKKSQITLEHLKKFDRHLKKTLAKEGLTNFRTNFRIKGVYSLYKKILRKSDPDKVFDIGALRIIVDTIDECYKILGIIHAHWRPIPGRIKDYIAFPKPDGYRSLHTTVVSGDGAIIEIQIKTKEMYDNSEYGTHISYKGHTNGNGKKTSKRSAKNENYHWIKRLLPKLAFSDSEDDENSPPKWVSELAEYNKRVSDDKEFMKTLKTDFFEERILVFTPKGDVVDLPIDATPVDFAYAIHSDIGNHTTGAKVNGKLVSLNTKIKNGDIVEISTKESSHPSVKWLDFVKTSMAKKHIGLFESRKSGFKPKSKKSKR